MRIRMAHYWQSLGHRSDFVLLQRRGELLDLLPDGTKVTALEATRMRQAFWPFVRYLRSQRPDALLVAMWPLTVLASMAARFARYDGRVVISEHSPLSIAFGNRGRMHREIMRASMRAGYPNADAWVAVSSGVADDLAALSGLSRSKLTVIGNPAAKGDSEPYVSATPPVLQDVRGPIFLSVGTLKRVKRHDLLVDAFARLPASAGATLCILGEGQERHALEQQIECLGLSGRVLLPGFASDTSPWYARADVFVLSSEYEGFGNVIVEAMEHGLPIISTDCPTGPREILAHGRYGTLVPPGDVQALAEAMLSSLARTHDAVELRARAREFSVERAADAYLRLLLGHQFREGQ